jgi:hypothetical protein
MWSSRPQQPIGPRHGYIPSHTAMGKREAPSQRKGPWAAGGMASSGRSGSSRAGLLGSLATPCSAEALCPDPIKFTARSVIFRHRTAILVAIPSAGVRHAPCELTAGPCRARVSRLGCFCSASHCLKSPLFSWAERKINNRTTDRCAKQPGGAAGPVLRGRRRTGALGEHLRLFRHTKSNEGS